MKSLATLFLFSTLSLSSALPAQAVDKYGTPRAKELQGKLAECTDHENFDSMDCYRALDAELEVERQATLPDNQRSNFSVSGKELLVERDANLRVGIFVIEMNGKKLRELQIFDNKSTYGFILGAADGCSESNFSVLNNTLAFTLLVDSCFYESKRGTPKSSHNYLMYSKKEKAVFRLIQSETAYQPNPSLELRSGIYRFQWNYALPDKKLVHLYYHFQIKSESEAQCTRMWDDDCPISPLKKRIIRND